MAFRAINTSRVQINHILKIWLIVSGVLMSFGWQLYAGFEFRCSDVSSADLRFVATCSGSYFADPHAMLAVSDHVISDDVISDDVMLNSGVLLPRTYHQPPTHFNGLMNSFWACIQLFVGTETETLIREIRGQREHGNGVVTLLPVIIYVLVCQIVVWQLLRTIVLQGLRITNGMALQTNDQKIWEAMVQKSKEMFLSLYTSRARGLKLALKIQSNTWFQSIFDLAVVVNIGTMLSWHDGLSQEAQGQLFIIDAVCLGFYFSESVLLLLGYLHEFFWSLANVFDLIVNLLSLVDLMLTATSDGGGGFNVQALKAIRAMRIIRLGRRIKGIAQFAKCVQLSVQASSGAYLMLMLIVVFAAIAAQQMFANVKEGLFIQHQTGQNFDSLASSVLLMFSLAVGNSFALLTVDLQVAPPACSSASIETGYLSDCGPESLVTGTFLLAFCFVTRCVICPLIASTVLNAFLLTAHAFSVPFSAEELSKFEKCWVELDPWPSSGYLALWKLDSLLDRLRVAHSALYIDSETSPEQLNVLRKLLKSEAHNRRAQHLQKMQSSCMYRMQRSGSHTFIDQMSFESCLNALAAFGLYPHALVSSHNQSGNDLMDALMHKVFDQKLADVLSACRRKDIEELQVSHQLHTQEESATTLAHTASSFGQKPHDQTWSRSRASDFSLLEVCCRRSVLPCGSNLLSLCLCVFVLVYADLKGGQELCGCVCLRTYTHNWRRNVRTTSLKVCVKPCVDVHELIQVQATAAKSVGLQGLGLTRVYRDLSHADAHQVVENLKMLDPKALHPATSHPHFSLDWMFHSSTFHSFEQDFVEPWSFPTRVRAISRLSSLCHTQSRAHVHTQLLFLCIYTSFACLGT